MVLCWIQMWSSQFKLFSSYGTFGSDNLFWKFWRLGVILSTSNLSKDIYQDIKKHSSNTSSSHSPTSLPHCWDCIHCGGLGPAYAKHAGTNLGKTNSSVIWLRNLLLISVRLLLMFGTVLCWRETSCSLWWTLCESSNTWLCFQELARAREQLLWFDLLLLIIYASVLLLIDTHK